MWPLTFYRRSLLLKRKLSLTVIGRKSSLFFDTVFGAKAGANIYTLIETAKANGIDPNQYLNTVFAALPNATTVEQIESLLPFSDEFAKQKLVN